MSRVLQLMSNRMPGGVAVLAQAIETGLAQRGHKVKTMALTDGVIAVGREVLRGRYDAILAYQVAAGLFGAVLGSLARVPVRATHLTAIPSAMRVHWRLLDRLAGTSGLLTHVIANSGATASSVATYPATYRQRLLVTPHGVPTLPPATGPCWRKHLAIPNHTLLLVTGGRLVEQKDHASAVAALVHLPNAHLVIAGEGELRAALLQLAVNLRVADRLHLVGNLDPSRLAALLRDATLFLYPSRWESFGLSGVEAGLAGLPIVASDLPVLREVLASAVAAFHPQGDHVALADAVSHMLQHYPNTAQREAAGAALADTYAVSRMIDAYCRLIDPSQ